MSMGMFDGRVSLVTGGAAGLGHVIVRRLVGEGSRVAFTYLNSEEGARNLLDEFGERVLPLRSDASDYSAAERDVNATLEEFGRLDVLVNNAARAVHKAFLSLSSDDVDFSWRNTFLSAFNYSQAAAKTFERASGGAIVSVGSINGERGREGSMPYCAAKAAIEAMTKTMAKELGESGIRCNVVSPGFIATEGQEGTSALVKKLVLSECAIRHLTLPEEVADLVLFLASDKARSITGQVYRIDCGQYI